MLEAMYYKASSMFFVAKSGYTTKSPANPAIARLQRKYTVLNCMLWKDMFYSIWLADV